jgi:hypothetical protein
MERDASMGEQGVEFPETNTHAECVTSSAKALRAITTRATGGAAWRTPAGSKQ